MNKKMLVGLFLLLLIPTWLFAGVTGKISGFVKDQETGDPLPGVNIIINETMMGAATDINGFYIILNVPVGTYVLKATYIGYKTVDISNIRVHADLTTEVNFQLPPTVLEGEMVSIVAERPIINKNVTSSVKTIQAEDLKNIPMRGVQTVMNMSSAVVGGTYVRGGRSEETVSYVDGVLTQNLRDGTSNALSVINNAIEESNFYVGGFNAEYGFATSGILLTTTKTGSADYHASFEGISDEVFKDGTGKFLGEPTWGYNTYTFTASGPIPLVLDKKLRFFLAGERNYNGGYGNNWEGIAIDTVMTSFGKTVEFKNEWGPGRIPGYRNGSYDLNGNLVYTLPTIRLRVGSTYHDEKSRAATMWGGLFDTEKASLTKSWNASAYFNVTHNVNPRLYYTFNLNYFFYKQEFGDPTLWDDIEKYGDPQYNSGYRDWGKAYEYNLFGFFTLLLPGEVWGNYGKTAQTNYGPKLDLTWQFNNFNELRAGFEYNYYTIRRYNIGPRGVSLNLHNRAIDPAASALTDYDLYRANLTAYGYDIYGNEINTNKFYNATDNQNNIISVNGHDAARHPIRGAFYLQDRIELKDLVLNAGLRFDYFKTGTESWKDPARLIINSTAMVDDASLGPEKEYFIVSPRVGWSFPVTDRTVFHAQFGKFVQMPQMDNLYDGYSAVARFLQGGNARTQPNPNLAPQTTIQYEVGLKQQIGENASLNLTAFYKDEKDKIQIRTLFPEEGYGYAAFYQLTNVDFGTVKGFSVSFELRRSNRISAFVDYTYSKAMGTGSNSGSHFQIAWQDQDLRYPTIIQPLDFNQDHVATFNLDFRLTKDDGPTLFDFKPLANLGINVLYSMHSGSRYTQTVPGPLGLFAQNAPQPMEAINASVMPWYYRMDLKIDRAFDVAQFKFKPYIWIYNVLNRKNVTGVYTQTGDPHDNGWFLTNDGKAWEKINGETGMYYARKWLSGAGNANLSTPRILRFGMLIEF